MKKNYFNAFLLGIMFLTIQFSQSQKIFSDGDFSLTTKNISFNNTKPSTSVYLNNFISIDLSPAVAEKVVISGNFQSVLLCENDWDPNCPYTELTFNSSTGLYTGTFLIPEGNNRYKVTVGGSWDTNYGENGVFHGSDISLCLPSGPEEITFVYDPSTNLVTTSPITSGFSPECLPMVVLTGFFQDELGCESDWVPDCTNTTLTYNPGSGLFEGDLNIPAGCYQYRAVLEGNWQNSYGQDGIYYGPNYLLHIPENAQVSHFTYDPVSHIVTSTPYSGAPQEVTAVSLIGTFQDELGCAFDDDYECDNPALLFNPDSGEWEASFKLPSGCYTYSVKETLECNEFIYGENGIESGNWIQLFVPEDGEITFRYDPQTHIISSNPNSVELTQVTLIGSLQDELGCDYDYQDGCNSPSLIYDPDSGTWKGNFTLPAGCYTYRVSEKLGCNFIVYGENGIEWGSDIQLYIPEDGEIAMSYDPQTHIITSTPYSGVPQEPINVSLIGTLQDELGCAIDVDYECESPSLIFNPDSNAWEGSYFLPAGCYGYRVKETGVCNDKIYGDNGFEFGNDIQLFVPSDSEIKFSYDAQKNLMISTPYAGGPEEVTKVSLLGTFQDELGCVNDEQFDCDSPALIFNSNSGVWEGTFTLPAGCYTYRVKQIFSCNILSYYGENGIEWGEGIQLYVPAEGEITFSYDPETHIVSSTGDSLVPQEITNVSFIGNLQDELGCSTDYHWECDSPALTLNPDSGVWEGSFMLPAGCYFYFVKETFGCNTFSFYGENGIEYGDHIQLYVPEDGEITFSYDPQTHIISSTPEGSSTQEISQVSLYGTLQDELGCANEFDNYCDNPALQFNPDSDLWEGIFTLPEGCYVFWVKETYGCNNITFYGEYGIEFSDQIQLFVPAESEITFSYNSQTHILSSTPYSGAPQELMIVSLVGSFQDELGCDYDNQFDCDNPVLLFNPNSGVWEGTLTLPAGCYTYLVQETIGCNFKTIYGENGNELGDQIPLFLPMDGEVTFIYDPQTNIIRSTSNTDLSTVNQCPVNILVDNTPGDCGAFVDYPEFVATANCGGEILMVSQTEGLPSGSFFPVGKTTNSFLLTTNSGEEITCSFDVVVTDTESPIISGIIQSHETLWPPNHKMVPVSLEYFTSDNCGIASTELFVSSNEPVNGQGDGNTSPDWEILDEHNVLLRAERSGKGNGREYYITIKVTDSSGVSTEEFVTVTVPHDKGKSTYSETGNDKYTLYPNATDDIINIKGPKSTSNLAYGIYDMLGVLKKEGFINNEPIEVRTLPSGVYILKFETDEGYLFKKFIKN